MIEKYGKQIEMKKINRNLKKVNMMIEESRVNSEKCYRAPEKGVIPQCRICGSKEATLFVSVWGKYHYYQCNRCNSLFLHNLPDVEEMYTENETMNGKHLIDDAVYEKRVKMITEPKIKFVMEVCREKGINVSRWIDIGCGGGEVLSVLQNMDIQAYGIEPDKTEYQFAVSKGLHVYNRYVNVEREDPYVSKLVRESDVVSVFDVIEHVINPVPFVKYLIDNLKSGGVLVFEVPRHPSMASFANLTCSHAVYRHILAPVHLFVFSEDALKFLLGDQAEIIGKWEFGQGYTDLLTNAMVLSGHQESPLYDELMELNNKIQPIIDAAGYADVMLVVVQKL